MNSLRGDLEGAKLSRSHIRVMLISGMSFFTDAYDLFVIGVALLMLKQVFSLTPTQMGYAASAALFGAVIGPVIFGKLADKYGRKRTYWITISILIVGAIGSSLSFSLMQLVFWRFLLGLGIGGDYPLSSTIVAEYANRNDRGKLVASTFAMQGFGIATGVVVALLLLYANVPEGIAWRLLLAIGAVPSLLIMYFRLKFKETPLYDIFRGKLSSARSTLKEITNKSISSADFIPATTLAEFARRYPNVVLGTALAWFLMDISYYGTGIFTPYLATVFGFTGTFAAVKVSSVLMLAMAVPGYWLAVALIDREGRKKIQAVGFLMMGLLFLLISALGPAMLKASSLLFFFVYGLTFFFTNYGPNTTTYVYPTELYPTSIRATGHGIASTSGKLGAAISTLIFPLLIKSIGEFALIGVLGIIALAGFLITLFLLPETKRKPLSETSGEESLMLITYSLQDKFRKHIQYTMRASKLLSEMAYRGKNARYFRRIKRYEHIADKEIREIFDIILNSKPSSTTYVDVSHLAGRLDNVIDGIEKVASRMVIYDAKPNGTIRKFAEGIEKSVGIISESFEMLVRLSLNTSNFEKERNRLRDAATAYENEGDMLLRKSLKQLAKEKDAVKMVEYKDIYEALEEVTDRCIDVLDVMSDISLRYLQNRKGSLF
jgi:PHS family inorganic phosphate transporter-like MFS transporter